MASEEEIKIAEKVKFWEEQEEVNIILAERIAYLNEELEKTKSQSKTNQESLAEHIAYLYDDLESLRSKSVPKKTSNTSNTKLPYLTLFASLVAITFSVIALLL